MRSAMTLTDGYPSTMNALVVYGAGDYRVESRQIAALDPGAVRVRVAYGGICGSDLHYVNQGRNGDFVIREPLVLGHEISGTVAEVGENAATNAPHVGTPVTVHPATPSPAPGTRKGQALNRYPGGSYFGSAATTPHTQGAFVDYIDVRPDQLRVLPSGLSLRRGALSEPLAVGLHAVNLLGDVTGRSVLVSGAGPIGALAVLALKHRGAGEIIVSDLQPSALVVVRAVGADRTIAIGKDADLEPGSVDLAIEASGAPAALRTALHAVAPGGTIVQLGILPPGEIPLSLGELQSREIVLRGSFRFDIELDEAVSVLVGHPEADAVISHQYDLTEINEAISIAGDPSASSKVLIRFDPTQP